MRNVMWIYVLVVFSSESCSMETGTNEITSMKPNTTSPPLTVYVYKQEVFNLGSSVNLACGDKTSTETLYVMWNLKLKHKTCQIKFNNDGQYINTCNDSKSLQNNTSNQSYLHIPNISADDVGLYECELVYTGGNKNYNISVTLIVPPTISAWLERRYNKLVAVCRAEGGSPAANISWSLTENSASVKTLAGPGGFLTVESDLELPGDRKPENLTCIVRHQFWDHKEILVSEVRKGFTLFQIIIPVTVVVIVLLVGFTALALKKVKLLRCCQLSDTQIKSSPMEDVEEVEPYASYTQRVNSIYN